MEFLKLFADMEQLFEPFSFEERGKLFSAMMAYAFNGVEPEFTGNERFLWPVLRRHINQCNERAETLRENGSKGGRPKTKENQRKPNETKENQTKQKETLQEQEQEQEHIQEQEQEQRITRTREPAPAAAEKVIAFDGQDLTADIERNHEADALVMRYGLSKDYATRERLLEDLEKYGSAKLREALEKAVDGNKKERITPNFWRAILTGKGRDSPTNNGVGYGQVLTQREYTPEEFKVMEVDISAIDSHGRLPGELGYGT